MVWASLGRYGQGWAKVARSRLVRLIRGGWAKFLVAGCDFVCRFKVGVSGCGQVLASMGKGGQVWMGQTDQAGIGNVPSGWVLVCVQV